MKNVFIASIGIVARKWSFSSFFYFVHCFMNYPVNFWTIVVKLFHLKWIGNCPKVGF